MDWLDLLRPWHGALLGFAVALGVALGGARLGRPLLGAAAGGFGVLAGWWLSFGLLTATPRQLPERLPLLMLGLLVLLPLALAARRWPGLRWPLALPGALWAGWWMGGAPRILPDLERAAPVLVGVGLATLLLAGRGGPRWAMPVAAAALLAGLAVAAQPGPQPMLAAALAAAALAVSLVPAGRGALAAPAAALPLAGGMAALAAIPLLARGAAADWAAAAAPLVALLIGPVLGARLHRRFGAPIGAALAGAAAVLAAWALR
jgi:hypothetical protein